MRALFTPLRIVLLVGLVAAAIAGFVLVPPGMLLPVHWNADGVANHLAPREVALLLPLGMAAIVWALYFVLLRFARAGEVEAGRRPLGVALTAITGLALLLQVTMLLIGLGVPVNVVQLLALALGVVWIALGIALPRSRPNGLAGIRIPSTLRDPANWQATHRLTGVLSVAGGVVLVAAALLLPTETLIWWLLGCLLVPYLVGMAYSLSRGR